MRPVKFGLFLPQVGLSFAAIKQRAQLADRLGFDSVLFVDHMWSRGMMDLEHLEAWTLMSATAAVTERIRIGALVLCNSYRNPALLAKMASSLDVISNGRLLLGIGAGWMEEEYHAYGYPFPRPRIRVEQLEEALQVMKHLFTEKRATFQGKYYAVADAANEPKPVQKPHPPILIGGAGEQLLLKVVARHADIWNCPNNHAQALTAKLEVLRRHCEEIGRDPSEIEVSEQCIIVLGADEPTFIKKWKTAKKRLGAVFDLEQTSFRGTPEVVVEQLEKRVQQGVTYFTFLLSDFHAPETLQLFAEKIVPAFR